jgi:hypothetical protein
LTRRTRLHLRALQYEASRCTGWCIRGRPPGSWVIAVTGGVAWGAFEAGEWFRSGEGAGLEDDQEALLSTLGMIRGGLGAGGSPQHIRHYRVHAVMVPAVAPAHGSAHQSAVSLETWQRGLAPRERSKLTLWLVGLELMTNCCTPASVVALHPWAARAMLAGAKRIENRAHLALGDGLKGVAAPPVGPELDAQVQSARGQARRAGLPVGAASGDWSQEGEPLGTTEVEVARLTDRLEGLSRWVEDDGAGGGGVEDSCAGEPLWPKATGKVGGLG